LRAWRHLRPGLFFLPHPVYLARRATYAGRGPTSQHARMDVAWGDAAHHAGYWCGQRQPGPAGLQATAAGATYRRVDHSRGCLLCARKYHAELVRTEPDALP